MVRRGKIKKEKLFAHWKKNDKLTPTNTRSPCRTESQLSTVGQQTAFRTVSPLPPGATTHKIMF